MIQPLLKVHEPARMEGGEGLRSVGNLTPLRLTTSCFMHGDDAVRAEKEKRPMFGWVIFKRPIAQY